MSCGAISVEKTDFDSKCRQKDFVEELSLLSPISIVYLDIMDTCWVLYLLSEDFYFVFAEVDTTLDIV